MINTERTFHSFYVLLSLGTLHFLIHHNRCIETVYGREGDNITLVCPFSLQNLGTRTSWRGPPSHQIYFYNDLKNPDACRGERLSVVKNETTGAYNLINIRLERQEDEGLYACVVNTNPVQENIIFLTFYDLPIIAVFQANQKQVNESTSFGLTCIVNSSTSTNISIQNKETGEVIRTGISTDTLSFTETSAKCYQTAQYICTATNIGGRAESDPVRILVNCGPIPINSVYVQRTYLSPRGSLDLSANVTGHPAPKFKWMFISKDDVLSKTISSSFEQIHVTLNLTTHLFRLKKNVITADEFGLYTIQLSNIHGMIAFYFYVIREAVVEVPQNISLVCSAEGVAFLTWAIQGYYECAEAPTFVVLYRLSSDHQSSNTSMISGTSVMLKNLLDNSDYLFTVTAIYREGHKTSSQQMCTIPDKSQKRSERSNAVPLLSTFLEVLIMACFGQLIFIIIWKVCRREQKDNSLPGGNGGNRGDYVMQNIIEIEDHQYQTITPGQKN